LKYEASSEHVLLRMDVFLALKGSCVNWKVVTGNSRLDSELLFKYSTTLLITKLDSLEHDPHR